MKREHTCQLPVTVGAIAVGITAMAFYEVRELVAALIIFSILFGTIGMALLTLFLIQGIALKGLSQLESRAAYVRAQHAAASGQRPRIMH